MAKKPTTSNAADALPLRQPKYDPAEFIIPAKDAKGESIRMWNRIQPGHDRAISAIFNSRKFPFKTPGDVVRWCLHTGLKRLEVMEGLPSVTQQVEAMFEILRDEEFRQEFTAFLTHATKVINQHVTDGSRGEARRLIAALQTKVQGMPDGHWKKRYSKEIGLRFGHLLEEKTAQVHIGTFGQDEDDDE